MEPKVKFKGGGTFVQRNPQFSMDEQTIFVAWRCSIVSYNTKTAKRLRDHKGLQSPVLDFCVHWFRNFEHLTACSTTGEVVSWKVDLGLRVLKTEIPGGHAIESFKLISSTESNDDKNVRFLVSWPEGDRTLFGIYNIATWKLTKLYAFVKRTKYSLDVNNTKQPFFAVVQGRKLYFFRLQDSTPQLFRHGIGSDRQFTCVKCHPSAECIITGDNTGRVVLWHDLASASPAQAVFHWHTLPVRCMAFSASGSNFYSGAGEAVLVKWHFDDSHHKEFLPRLPGTLEHINVSPNGRFVAVATADNAIRVLDPKLDTVSIIQHLVLSAHFPAGIKYDRRTKCMVLNGLTGHVQFYSPQDMTLLYNLDVVGQNKLTQERDCHIENTNVTRLAISSCGSWVATVEERADISYSFELRLKFFEFDPVKQVFQLNTFIELPHEKSITQIAFRPSKGDQVFCVTVGNDKKFKLWQLVDVDGIDHKGRAWQCDKVGSYRDSPCNTVAFSADGSLLAVGFQAIATAWSPETFDVKCSLVHPTHRDRLTHLHFGAANQCHLLVACTGEQLSVWNLLSLCMTWTVRLNVSVLVASPLFMHMAVFTTDGKLYVFYPNSSTPVFTHTLAQGVENVVAAAFVPSSAAVDYNAQWHQGSQLYFITSKQELYSIDADEEQTEIMDAVTDDVNGSLFTSMVPKTKSSQTRQSKPVRHLTDISYKNKQLKQLLDAPVHTMIPMRLMCGNILKSFVLERKQSDKLNVT